MISRLLAAALGLSVFAAQAHAQDSDTITIESTVTAYCADMPGAVAALNLGDLIESTGFLVDAFVGDSEREVAAGYYCNAPATVTLKASPLMHETVTTVADHTSFTNRVDYTASLEWGGVAGSVASTLADGDEIEAAQATIGALIIRVAAPTTTDNRRPVAGAYEGAVTLTVALNP